MANPVFVSSLCATTLANTSLSYVFSAGSTANRAIVVFVRISSDSDIVTAVTCNSVAPVSTVKALGNGGPYHNFYLYLFNAPATGTATISITTSSSTDIFSGGMSFANVSQGGFDSTTVGLLSSGTNYIVTTNPVANNSILGMFVWNSAAVPTAGNLVTLESQASNTSTVTAWVDTTNISPAAQVFPSVTTGAATAFAGITFTLAPVPTVTLVTSIIGDRTARTKPPTPVLGTAGYTFNDPTFTSWIGRVTDGNSTSTDPDNPATGESFNLNANTTQHGWSPDSTKFYVQRTDGNFWVVNFDPVGLTWTFGRTILLYDDITWDSGNSNALYGSLTSAPNHHTVGKVDITSVPYVYSTLFDAATVVNTVLGAGTFPTGDTYLNTIMCAAVTWRCSAVDPHRILTTL